MYDTYLHLKHINKHRVMNQTCSESHLLKSTHQSNFPRKYYRGKENTLAY